LINPSNGLAGQMLADREIGWGGGKPGNAAVRIGQHREAGLKRADAVNQIGQPAALATGGHQTSVARLSLAND
jgi:hypothetical protein